jgi:hypothetical protein
MAASPRSAADSEGDGSEVAVGCCASGGVASPAQKKIGWTPLGHGSWLRLRVLLLILKGMEASDGRQRRWI